MTEVETFLQYPLHAANECDDQLGRSRFLLAPNLTFSNNRFKKYHESAYQWPLALMSRDLERQQPTAVFDSTVGFAQIYDPVLYADNLC